MSKFYFSRRILSSLLLASITIATPVSYVALSSSIVRAKLPDNFDYIRRCDINEIDNSIPVLQEQAIKALDKKELETSINYLQKILNLSKQSKNFFVLSWLEGDSNGGESYFQRLINLAQIKKQTPKVINLLGQFSEITNRISASSSTSKVDYFVKIAEYYHQLGQKEQALKTLNQALQAERFIQGAAFRANASINIARVYIKLGQRATAMKLSAAAEKFIQQIPKASANQKESPLFNLAQVYAQLGADSELQKLISTQSGNAKNAVINGAVPVYINAKKLGLLETMIKQVKATEQNILLLGQLAAGYGKNKQTDKAKAIFQQALQAISSPANKISPDMQESLTANLVNNYLQAGFRDEALQIVRSSLKNNLYLKTSTLRDIAVAYNEAKESGKAASTLSETIEVIKSMTGDVDKQFAVPALLDTAINVKQFNLIGQQWQNLSNIVIDEDRPLLLEGAAIAYAKAGKYEEGVRWIEQFPSPLSRVVKVNFLNTIAVEAAQSNRKEFANKLLQQSLALVNQFTQEDVQKFTRRGDLASIKAQETARIALQYARIGQLEKMRQLLNKLVAISSQGTPNSYPTDSYFIFILFLNSKTYPGAIQIAETTKNLEYGQERFVEIARKYMEDNRHDALVPIMQKIPNSARRLELLTQASLRHANLGRPSGGFPQALLPILDKLVVDVQKQKNEPAVKTLSILNLANIYRNLGNQARVLALLDAAFPIAQKVPGDEYQVDRLGIEGGTIIPLETDRGSMYENIATLYAEFGQRQKAIQVANKLQNKSYREVVVRDINCILNKRR